MRIPLFLKLLRGKQALIPAFILIYGLGLAIYMTVDSLSRQFQAELTLKSKEMLEGELRIESRRNLTDTENAALQLLLPAGTQQAQVWGFLSMLKAGDKSRLVEVKGISPEYPLIGRFELQGNTPVGDLRPGEIFFPRELILGLDTRVGDSVDMGGLRFLVRDEYTQVPGGGLRFIEFGSKVFIPLSDVERSGLDQKGSRIFRYRFYMFPPGTDLVALKNRLEAVLTDPEIEIDIHSQSDSRLGRSFTMVSAFMRMVSLTALLLAAIGASFFFHHHLVGERKTQAVLATLGLTSRKVVLIYAGQNLVLALSSALVGGIIALGLSRILPGLIQRLFGIEVPMGLALTSFSYATLLAISTGLIFGISSFRRIAQLSPALLIKPTEDKGNGLPTRLAIYALQTGYLLGLGYITSGSWQISAMFIGSMALAFGCLALMAFFAYRLLGLWRARADYRLKVILGSFRWNKEKSLMAFGALGLVAFSSALLPQLQFIIKKELGSPEGTVVPQLFLFDIQEEQFDPLKDFLDSVGYALRTPSPMIRARLEKLNDEDFRKVVEAGSGMEEQERRRIRNRGFNLSFRDSLSDAEQLVEGRLWTDPADLDAPDPTGEISVEIDFAKRFGLKMGDKLTFDVQGVSVDGVITSMRRVRWASFQPNFFVLFQPGVLDLAPKTFLATLEKMPMEEVENLQTIMAERFPNVTVLNVQDVVNKTLEVLGKLQWLITFLSSFALIIGLAILGVIINGMVADGQRNVLLLRTLGVTQGRLARMLFAQYLGFCMLAGMTGYGLSLVAVYFINRIVWNFPWGMSFGIMGASLAASALVGTLCGLYAAKRQAKRPLREVLSLSRN